MKASAIHLLWILQGGAANTSHFPQGYVKFPHNSQAYTCTLTFGITVSLPVFVPPPVALVKLSSSNCSEREPGFYRYLHCLFVFYTSI